LAVYSQQKEKAGRLGAMGCGGSSHESNGCLSSKQKSVDEYKRRKRREKREKGRSRGAMESRS